MSLKLGFVGGGLNSVVGYTHFVAARMDGHFEVAAGCFSRDAAVNIQTGEVFGVPRHRVYPDIDQMLSARDCDIDAVCILTPTPSHAEMVVKCLKAGRHVICEKALATSMAECDVINAAQLEAKKFVGVTFNYAGYPMIREMRHRVQHGDLGPVQQVFCEMPQESFSRDSVAPQAWRTRDYVIPCVSLDLGVHVHHLVTYVTGVESPINTSVQTGGYGKVTGVVDTVAALSKFEPNVLVSMMWGKAAIGYRNGLRLRVFCERGSLEWNQLEPETLIMSRADGSREILDRGSSELSVACQSRYNRFKAGHPAGFIEAFANIYADFKAVLAEEIAPEDLSHFTHRSAISGLSFLESLTSS